MIYISIEDIKKEVPSVYAWNWKFFPELEHYRAIMWMNLPFKDAEKCRYDKYIPMGIARTKESAVKFLHTALMAELESNAQRGINRV